MTSLSSVNNFENNGCPHISKQVAEQVNTQNANNKIPLVDLKSNYNRMKKEIDASIADVLQSCYFIGSPHVKQFEKNFATFIGTKHCIGVNSGTDALILAMKFLGIGPGDEVIVQANTFIATCLGVSNNGADIVLVDNDPDTYMIKIDEIEKKITTKTKAIIVVHLYGSMPDMDAICNIAKKNNLLLIEDAAQAHGATFKGQRAGSFGDVGCFSFYPGKNLGAFGDGGAIVTNNDELSEKIKWWRSWGAAKKYHHEIKGGNSRLDSIQAAVLNVKLKYIDQFNSEREQHAKMYTNLISNHDNLKNIVKLPSVIKEVVPVWHLYVLQVDKRDELLKHFHDNGIGAGIHYPIPIHQLGAYKELLHYGKELPNCTNAASKLISLPIFPELTEIQIQRIVDVMASFYTT